MEALPSSGRYPEGGEALFKRLAGATIIKICSPAEEGIEGGGLVIDYVARGSSSVDASFLVSTNGGCGSKLNPPEFWF
jgi:hypothetical protein